MQKLARISQIKRMTLSFDVILFDLPIWRWEKTEESNLNGDKGKKQTRITIEIFKACPTKAIAISRRISMSPFL